MIPTSCVLALMMIDEELLEQKVTLWLETPFEGGRHARRVEKIMDVEDDGSGI